jgi:hypothetical protein
MPLKSNKMYFRNWYDYTSRSSHVGPHLTEKYDKLERFWKEAFTAYFQVRSHNALFNN